MTRKTSNQVVSLPTKEDALRYFQQFEPDLQPKDVRSGVSEAFVFVYENDQTPLQRGYLTLPARWED